MTTNFIAGRADTQTIGNALNPAAFRVFSATVKEAYPSIAYIQFTNVGKLRSAQPLPSEVYPAVVKAYLQIITGQNELAKVASMDWDAKDRANRYNRAVLRNEMRRATRKGGLN